MNDNAYLVIHGFGGGTEEVQYLVDFLRKKGLDVYTVVLAGHGSTKEALRSSGHADWCGSVKDKIDELLKVYNKITLIGFSMGGLLAIRFLALPHTTCCVLINTPVYFWNIGIILRDTLEAVINADFSKASYYTDAIFRTPAKSCFDFLKILSVTVRLVGRNDKSALIIQCRDDESVHYKSAYYLKNKAGKRARLVLYDGGCHQIFTKALGIRDKACEDIWLFINSKEAM